MKDLHQERTNLRRNAPTGVDRADLTPSAHPLVTLGQQVGNAQIARMLAQREAMPEEEEELQLSRDPALQREELPEDEEELQLSRDPALQREAVPEEEELQLSRDPALQREAIPEVGPEGGPVSDATASRINRLRGGGSALDPATRGTMEQALGASFADVRIHTGSEAAQLSRSLGAKAFTTGSDIFFGADASPADQSLLAHELTHVSQQRAMSGHSGAMTVGAADDAYEQAAEATAARVSAGVALAQRETKD